MEFWKRHCSPLVINLLLFCLSFSILNAQTPVENTLNNRTVSSLLVFGDSTVDPGNNNFLATIIKSDFPPYGQDFKNHLPTGRFTNGRLTTDFIASYAGLKETVPAYLDPTLSIEDLLTGVSFASAGSGFDPLTSMLSNVIGITRQFEYLREYKQKIESAMGKTAMENHMKRAVFLISAGTNDFVINYFGLQVRRNTFTVSAYQQFILSKLKQLIQSMLDEGARTIVVAGLPPMGCVPLVITLNSKDPIQQRDCVETYSSVARGYNLMLQNELNSLQKNLAHLGTKIFYIDIYNPLNDMIQGRRKFGFENVNSGCCGTGYLEASILCNPSSYVCPNASTYVFFDSVHPTEKAYSILFQAIRPVADVILKG